MSTAFEADAFHNDSFQIDTVVAATGTAFQADAFQTTILAFQIDEIIPGVPAANYDGPPLANDVGVWLGGYDLSGALSAIDLMAARIEMNHSRMTDELEASYPGEQQINAGLHGAWAAGTGEPDTVAALRLFSGSFTEWPLTILPPNAPGAAGDDGNVAYNVRSVQHALEVAGTHGGILPFSLRSRPSDGILDRGTVMVPKATRTASFNGTERALGALQAGDRLVCVLHVFSVTGSGGSVTVTVENGPSGFATSTVMGTFTAVTTATGVSRQVLVITSPAAESYWRIRTAWTAGTNYVLAAVAALEES